MHAHNSNTEKGITEETASLVDWIKATVKSVYCEKGNSIHVVTNTCSVSTFFGLNLQWSGCSSTQYAPYSGQNKCFY